MGNLTFAVAGNGPADKENIRALLEDWLGYHDTDPEGFYTGTGTYGNIRLILPLTDDDFTAGVAMVHLWSALADIGFTGVISATEPARSRAVKGAKGEADDLVTAQNVHETLIDLLMEADPGDEVVLLVLHEDTDPDEATRELIETAFERGITDIRNLSYGLAPIEAPAAPDPEPEPAPVAPEPAQDTPAQGTLTDQLRAAALRPLEGTEIIHTVTRAARLDATNTPADPVQFVFDQFEALLQFHVAFDVLGLTQHGRDSGAAGSLTENLMRTVIILQQLLNHPLDGYPDAAAAANGVYATPEALDTDEDTDDQTRAEDATPGTKNTKPTGKTRREFLDPDTGQWRPAGRGRPRKDVQFRDVPVEA